MTFADRVEQALATIDVEMRRMQDWIEHDRPRYWRTQIRVATDEVSEARAALHRRLMYPINDERPSCREERAALKKAEARQRYCEEKAERLKHWKREFQHELFQYEGHISQLVRVIETDVPEAAGLLGKLLDRLEQYQAVRTRSAAGSYDAAAVASQLWPDRPDVADGPDAKSLAETGTKPGPQHVAEDEQANGKGGKR